jgi:hypothetical protein
MVIALKHLGGANASDSWKIRLDWFLKVDLRV